MVSKCLTDELNLNGIWSSNKSTRVGKHDYLYLEPIEIIDQLLSGTNNAGIYFSEVGSAQSNSRGSIIYFVTYSGPICTFSPYLLSTIANGLILTDFSALTPLLRNLR